LHCLYLEYRVGVFYRGKSKKINRETQSFSIQEAASMSSVLYYVGDPMCSWCWGFRPGLQAAAEALPEEVPLVYVMGGLARDSDEPMPEETRDYVRRNWHEVTEETGATFNWDFWEVCEPRRSTYPACRAVLSAAAQRKDAGPEMFHAIQRAYYQEARNPSDLETLVGLSGELSPPLEVDRFERDIVSPEIDVQLHEDFGLRRSLGVRQFPSLVLKQGEEQVWIVKGYAKVEETVERLRDALGTRVA